MDGSPMQQQQQRFHKIEMGDQQKGLGATTTFAHLETRASFVTRNFIFSEIVTKPTSW
jgi:hypothetical protein